MRAQGRPSWGIVATTRAPLPDILRFAAYHLDLGADRVHLLLDEPNRRAVRILRQNPKIDIRVCSDDYWQRRKIDRPDKHQVRQSKNADFIYRQTDVDWLAHIDVDEFLWPKTPIPDLLHDIPDDIPAVRIRPIEALAGDDDRYKAFIPEGPRRAALVEALYPNYGPFLVSGFLSHTQGKLFVRTGLPEISDRIHTIFQYKQLLPCNTELPQIDLCHRHAPSWDHWMSHYRYRLQHGSYKPGLKRNTARALGGLNKHELLSWIEAEQGQPGLRAFYDEMSAANPDVRARLEKHGLILHRPLALDQKVLKHFPGTR
ncbi:MULTISPECIES: glycosyltransferase family 2 protein [unclassified Ruegeria]|uniref:glycosyltransferase family 2 protein n=1 Tax=unclassified Ruegeria TaxID=2625375 RepID=UPI001488663E|nr:MULTISPECIES: glycosyltransferase family 2 protein [unclassified Ruegeria]